jgi:hypothetical protein
VDKAMKRRKMELAEQRIQAVESPPENRSARDVMMSIDINEDGANFGQFGPLYSFMESLGENPDLNLEQSVLLAAFARCGLLRRSCHIAGVSVKKHYYWMKKPAYAETFEEAKKISAEVLEQLALELASGVYERPLVSQGHIAGYEKIYDTKLLMRMLQARNPEKYQQRMDVTSGGQSLVKLVDKDTWDSV